jgi:hypothetical protein
LPEGVEYVAKDCTSAKWDPATRTVTWSAREILTASGKAPAGDIANINVAIKLTVKLNAGVNNTQVVNQAEGEVVGASGGGTTGAKGNPTETEKKILEFFNLIAGQGRNTTVLGDENQFVAAVLKNAAPGYGLAGKEAQLRAIYKKAVAAKVNPLIMVVMWGVEQGWNINGTEFGCIHQRGSGFESQLTCRVNEVNHFMTEAEQSIAKKGLPFAHPVAPQCTYTDPFVYAYEKGTPVCAVNDSNGNARKNFVEYYKKLLGTK